MASLQSCPLASVSGLYLESHLLKKTKVQGSVNINIYTFLVSSLITVVLGTWCREVMLPACQTALGCLASLLDDFLILELQEVAAQGQ